MNNNLSTIEQLSTLFRNKKQFELAITQCSFELESNETYVRRINSVKSRLNDKEIKTLKLWYATNIFDEKIKVLLENIAKHITNKLDAIAEKKLKVEYLQENINKFNDVTKSILMVISHYPTIEDDKIIKAINISKEFGKTLYKQPFEPKSPVADDWIESIEELAENFFSNIPEIEKLKPLFTLFNNNDLLCMSLAFIINGIIQTIEKNIVDSKYILDWNIVIENEGALYKIIKPRRKKREEATLMDRIKDKKAFNIILGELMDKKYVQFHQVEGKYQWNWQGNGKILSLVAFYLKLKCTEHLKPFDSQPHVARAFCNFFGIIPTKIKQFEEKKWHESEHYKKHFSFISPTYYYHLP